MAMRLTIYMRRNECKTVARSTDVPDQRPCTWVRSDSLRPCFSCLDVYCRCYQRLVKIPKHLEDFLAFHFFAFADHSTCHFWLEVSFSAPCFYHLLRRLCYVSVTEMKSTNGPFSRLTLAPHLISSREILHLRNWTCGRFSSMSSFDHTLRIPEMRSLWTSLYASLFYAGSI